MAIGKLDEALIEAQLAAKLDPLALSSKFHLGELFYRSERYIDAIEIFDAILADNPFNKQVSIFKGWCHLQLGDLESATDIFKGIPITSDEKSVFFGGLAFAYYKQMQYDSVLECMRNFRLEKEKGKLQWLNYNYALIFRALGEQGKMFEYLKKGLEEKSTPLIFIQVDPVWKEFKSNTEFTQLVEDAFVSRRKDQIVNLNSDTREMLQLDLNKLLFVEAQENYSRIVWMDNEELQERLLRVSLKNIESQIADDQIIRCHRSYMINTRVPFKILGNSNGYHLTSVLFPDTLPISRSLGKSIVAKLRDINSKT
jgi:tetratricopeptide (TPR) repeat protein